MSKVSVKSTKAELLVEVERLQAELNAKREGSKTVLTVQQEKETAERSKAAKEIIRMNILNETIVKGYNDVMFAIEEAKKELAEIQDVKEAIIDAEAVIMAKEAIIAEREARELAKLAELKQEADEIIAERRAKVADLEAEYKEKELALKKERTREAEEFKYNQKRERQMENDKWEDEKAAREKELSLREKEVEAREIYMTDLEYKFEELEQKVEGIPTLVATAKEEAYAEAKKKADSEKAAAIKAVEKDAEWKIKVAEMEKDRAVEDLAKANDKIATLEAKLEAAYESMNTLATTTVQSTGGVKVLEVAKDK